MKIIRKANCIEGGNRSYFLLTADFASLEARLAAIDTFYNPETYPDPDPVLYSVYRDGSKTSDLHSMTGYGTFCSSVGMKAYRVHDDVDNKDYVFAPTSKVRVDRAGTEMVITAKELQENDHILEHMRK